MNLPLLAGRSKWQERVQEIGLASETLANVLIL